MYHKTVKISTLYLNKKSDNILHGTRISRTLQKTHPSFCWNSGCRSSNNNCFGLAKLSKSLDLGVLGPSTKKGNFSGKKEKSSHQQGITGPIVFKNNVKNSNQ